jgi:hypothetical protein
MAFTLMASHSTRGVGAGGSGGSMVSYYKVFVGRALPMQNPLFQLLKDKIEAVSSQTLRVGRQQRIFIGYGDY